MEMRSAILFCVKMAQNPSRKNSTRFRRHMGQSPALTHLPCGETALQVFVFLLLMKDAPTVVSNVV